VQCRKRLSFTTIEPQLLPAECLLQPHLYQPFINMHFSVSFVWMVTFLGGWALIWHNVI